MKRFITLIFIFSFFTQLNAQHKVKGTMIPAESYEWVILYKVEGAKQKFISNATIAISDSIINGTKTKIGKFSFDLKEKIVAGSYRFSYDIQNARYLDFIYNKEDVTFTFNPLQADESVLYTKSSENILYQEYQNAIGRMQQKLDQTQVTYLRNPSDSIAISYKKTLASLRKVQQSFLEKAKGKRAFAFIKATDRYNSEDVSKTAKEYLSQVKSNFFNSISFEDKTLYNSSFLLDRINDYIFYMNYSNNPETLKRLYKEAIATVLNKVKSERFKEEIIEFISTQFIANKKYDLVDYILNSHYKILPENIKSAKFLDTIEEEVSAQVGRIAPDFSWKQNNTNFSIATINEADNYLIVFWSTACSHCTRDIPKLHTFMQENPEIKVIAVSLERESADWNTYISKLKGWHNVLALKKWENPIARTYKVFSTPSFFILNKDKKIIAKPYSLEDVKKAVLELKK